MKNRNENTTNPQFSYRSFTFFESFFIMVDKYLSQKNSPFKGAKYDVGTVSVSY